MMVIALVVSLVISVTFNLYTNYYKTAAAADHDLATNCPRVSPKSIHCLI